MHSWKHQYWQRTPITIINYCGVSYEDHGMSLNCWKTYTVLKAHVNADTHSKKEIVWPIKIDLKLNIFV